MNKGEKAHNLPLHGSRDSKQFVYFFYCKNDAVYPVFRLFSTFMETVFILPLVLVNGPGF